MNSNPVKTTPNNRSGRINNKRNRNRGRLSNKRMKNAPMCKIISPSAKMKKRTASYSYPRISG
jgi:hypothetical protein